LKRQRKYASFQQNLSIQNKEEESASSPCIGVCQLDENKVCIGCFRTIEEIREAGRNRWT